jgi:hypothetical protein
MKNIALLVLLVFVGTKICAQEQALKTNLLYDLTTTINLGYEVALGKKMTLDIWANYNPWVLGYKWVGIEGTENYFNSETGKNPFVERREKKLKHWMVQPEIRWWLCEKFNGHFFGAHLHGGQFNVGAMSLPFGIGRYKYNITTDKQTGLAHDQFGQDAHGDKNWGDYLGKYPVKMQTGATLPDGRKVEVSGIQYKQGTTPYKGLIDYAGREEAENQLLYANADRDGIYTNSFEGWFVGAGVSYGYHWILTPRFSLEFTLGLGFAYFDYQKARCTDCRQVIAEGSDWYLGPTRAGIGLVWMVK